MLAWRFQRFADLTPRDVHDILRARSAVFVVEQDCVFQDVDGVDPACWHLMGRRAGESELAAYCRIVPPGIKFQEPSIGRVLTLGAARGTGLGRELVREALARAGALYPGRAIRIGAQQHLSDFYGAFGFETASEPYDEDGIVHVEMVRPATRLNRE